MICGGGHVCGILMLLSALVAVLVLFVCVTGSYFTRRRRQNILAVHAANHTAGGGGGGGAMLYRPPSRSIVIPSDQLDILRVRPGTPTTEGEVDEESSTTKECPICLDTIAVHPDTWAVFPCSHGCCRPCLGDLMRLSSRRVNDTTMAILCPLCRKLAVAPENMELENGRSPRGDNIELTSTTAADGTLPNLSMGPSTPSPVPPVASMGVEGPSPTDVGVGIEDGIGNDINADGQQPQEQRSRWNFLNRRRRWM